MAPSDRQECRNRWGDFCGVEKLIANKDGKRLFLRNAFLCNYFFHGCHLLKLLRTLWYHPAEKLVCRNSQKFLLFAFGNWKVNKNGFGRDMSKRRCVWMHLSYLHFEGFLIASLNLYPPNKLDLAAYMKHAMRGSKYVKIRKMGKENWAGFLIWFCFRFEDLNKGKIS